MAWQDRSYYRDQNPAERHPIWWLFYGSVPLFTAFGIRVRLHASMLVMVVLGLLFSQRIGLWNLLTIYGTTFVVVLLHEFGHCFAARRMGGDADEVILHPLGGLAMTAAPRRPWAQLVTTLGGPLVNVIICLLAVGLLFLLSLGHPSVSWNPLSSRFGLSPTTASFYVYYFYRVSLGILIFNAWPVYPLDGGRVVQELLWFKFGYYRATIWACTLGIVLAMISIVLALRSGAWYGGLTIVIYGNCLWICFRERALMKAEGPWAFEDESNDYSAAMWQPEKTEKTRRRKLSRRAVRKLRRLAHAEETEQKRIDDILAKVSSHGIASLTWSERRELRKATERQRDIEVPSDAEPRL